MKGELGSLAQAVAKYQMDRKIQKEVDKLKVMEEKLKEIQTETTKDQDVYKNFYISSSLIFNNLISIFLL